MDPFSAYRQLVRIASDFSVSNEVVSRIPTLAQGGYGCGIVLITPLGDLVRRRPLVLILMFLSSTLSIGLALSRNVQMLEALSFIVGVLTASLFFTPISDRVDREKGDSPDMYTMDGRSRTV